jgi:hypothetical protein
VNDTTDRTTVIYDALDAFQRMHRLPGLQHAQIRGLLAEHLGRVLPAPAAAAVPVPAADRATEPDTDPVRCPLCPDARILDTPAEARDHFETVHPEERLVGPGPWPLLANREQPDAVLPAPADRATVLREAAAASHREADRLYEDLGQHAAQGARQVAAVLRRMAAEAAACRVAADTTPAEPVHACPVDGTGITGCCGRVPFELPRTDRMTRDPNAVTCPGPVAPAQPGEDTEMPREA